MEGLSPDLNLGHYRIVSRLGVGGMGEVYLAHDLTLDRKVALKILPEEMALDSERMRRFVQEAKAASALNHPNIITIYEIGETDNKHFISTEYVGGQNLRRRLNSEEMSLNEVLDAAIQIASALQAAHEAKIIHRDIKPENVMVRPDGLVKLLDFGIAKMSEPALRPASDEATTLRGGTSPGFIVGTAAYMSPEQAKGEAVDARTDIFSFGGLLYDTLGGQKPFDGNNAVEIIGALLYKDAIPIRQLVPDVPSEIERILNKLLRKDVNDRYQTIKDVLIDLRDFQKELEFQDKLRITVPVTQRSAVRTSSSPSAETLAQTTSPAEYIVSQIKKRKLPVLALAAVLVAAAAIFYFGGFKRSSTSTENTPISSIAVLPFQNRSGDQEPEYLSDGLAESLIFGLSQLPDLKVSPTSSVFRYKGKEIDPIKIGNDLGVSAIMTGHVAQRGEDLSISVELVDVRSTKLIWGKHYDRKLTDLLKTQREIASEITQNLQLKISGADQNRISRHYAKNSEAYQLYLKGHYYASRYTKEGFNKGIEYFEQAITKDPNFALAYSGLAFCYLNQTDWVFAPKDSLPKARQAIENALRIDDTLAEAHTMRAMVLLQYDWNWPGAEKEFKRALELDPNYALGRSFYAWYLAAMGRADESVAEDRRALDLEPLSPAVNADLGWDLYFARRYDEGIDQLRKAVDLEPNYWVSRVLLGRCYEQTGKANEAVVEFQKAVEIENSIPEVLAALGHGYATAGRKAEALKVIRDLEERSKKQFVASYNIATIYAGLGMKDEAFQYLAKAYDEGSFYMIHLKVEPMLDPLRADPRFSDLLRRVGH